MSITINNSKISLVIDRKKGALVSISDGTASYGFSEVGFSLTANGRVYFANASAESCAKTANGVEFIYCDRDFTAKLRYILPENGAFVERELAFRKNKGEWNADKIVCENFSLNEAANEILFHDDQSPWHVPTNYFIRYADGGLYCGLEYPYWDTETDGKSTLTLGFSPNYGVKCGEWFVCEKTFLGTYRKEGITRTAHGPYPGPIKVTEHYPDIYLKGGIHQHFVDHKMPEDAGFPLETLDWGEVWAMQEFFTHYLPLQSLPEKDEWFLWQNGWWARLFSPDVTAIEPLLGTGVKDLMTAAIYYGHDNHPTTEPEYIRDMRIEPMGFPIYKHEHLGIGDATNDMHSYVEKGEEDEIIGYSDTFEAPRPYDELIHYAEERGIHIGSFCTPNMVYAQRPEWAATHKDGKPHEYFETRLGCAACDDYMNFHFEATSRVLDRYKARFWAFDGRWINFREIPGYHFGSVGEDQCYSDNHGHPVGDKNYKEWKNIEKFKAKLRKRYPNLCMEQYYGLKRGGAWSLVNFNSDENYYEMGSVANNRLQTYHNENGRFRPVYMNYSSIFGETPGEFEVSIISALSTSYYAQVSRGYNALRDYPECADILKKWKAFAGENLRYLEARRTLFGEPGQYAVDGSAHIIGNEGYIFLFTAPGCYAGGRIPMMRWIGLDEKNDAKYRIRVVAAVNEKGEMAEVTIADDVVSYGDTLSFRMSPDTAVVLKVEPAEADAVNTAMTLPFGPDEEIINAF